VFVTPSICYDSPRTGDHLWRKSLSWLDYGFLKALEKPPKHLIIGSFDDVHERNAWFICDTTHAAYGWQMRDITGKISTDAYYNRVREWLTKGYAEPFNPGGKLRDGAYQVISCDHGAMFGPIENRRECSPLRVKVPDSELDSLYWFYHLGNDEYRIVKLNTGFSLESLNDRNGSPIRQNYDSESFCQRWKLICHDDGTCSLIGRLHGKAFALNPAGDIVVDGYKENEACQRWIIKPIKTL